MKKIEISPSILSANFAILKQEIISLENSGADRIHLDVMDGHFVPNITFGADIIKSIREFSTLPFETHLMINVNEDYVNRFIDVGSDIILLHPESADNWQYLLRLVKNSGKKVGIVLNPDSKIEYLHEVIDLIDQVLLMTVYPGFGGQSFITSQLEVLKTVKRTIGNRDIDIAVDGGINVNTAKDCILAGANVLISGSAIFNTKDYHINIEHLRTL